MTLHDKFERIVVLNLPYKEDRKRRLTENLRTTGIADPDQITWNKAISGEWMNPPAWWNSGNGAWGCCISHIIAISQAIMDQCESLLILEDDAIFEMNAQDHLALYSQNWPDSWGQIYLGGQHLKEPSPVNTHWLRATNINRTHAYAVHKSAMSKMSAHCLYAPDYMSHRGWHIDHQLGIAHERKDWAVFAPKWWLAGQAADKSNISGQENRELWWQRIPAGFHSPILILPAEMKNTDPSYSGYCHAGCNLYRDTCEDIGAHKAIDQNGGLHKFLTQIANEAIWHYRVPAVQHPKITPEIVKKSWPGKVIQATEAEIPSIHAALMENLYTAALR